METLKDVIEALSAIVVAVVAIIGLNTWSREIRGRTEFEVAKGYLGTLYRIRKAIRDVRNPLISTAEMGEALMKRGSTEASIEADMGDNQKRNWAVYGERWDKVVEPLKKLDNELIEAEVIWGKDAVKVVDDFDAVIRKFRVDLEMFLRGFGDVKYHHGVIYDSGKGDTFSSKIEEAIKPVEEFLKPYVRKEKGYFQKMWLIISKCCGKKYK